MLKYIILTLFCVGFLSSCAFHDGLTRNYNGHITQVELTNKNYTITEYVEGKASATYVFGIGGLGKNALIASARKDMLASASLLGTSKAVINETVEVRHSIYPFVWKRKVVVSAYIVEFTGEGS